MKHDLPVAPADVLQVSSPVLRTVIRTVTRAAERFGFWKAPLSRAATATEEMTALDNLYWIHKSRHPIGAWESSVPETDRPYTLYRTARLPLWFQPDATMTMGIGGDLLRSPGIDHSQDRLFERVEDVLFDVDLSVANYESPVTDQPLVDEVIGDAGPPTECASPAQFRILTGHRERQFDMLHLANNHMYDMGLEGIERTLEALRQDGIEALGAHDTPLTHGKAVVMERNGIRIGFVSDCFGLNGRTLPHQDRWRLHVSNLLSKKTGPDMTLLHRQIKDCRARDCDFIVASVHWGYEFEFFPRARQMQAARELVEFGADSVICHHPHVIQPVEMYRTKRDPDRRAVIAYSLGSLTWGFTAPHIVLSTVLNLTLAKGRWKGRDLTYVAGVRATPVFRTHVEEDGVPVTRIEKLADHVDNPASPFEAEYIAAIRRRAVQVLGPDCLNDPTPVDTMPALAAPARDTALAAP